MAFLEKIRMSPGNARYKTIHDFIKKGPDGYGESAFTKAENVLHIIESEFIVPQAFDYSGHSHQPPEISIDYNSDDGSINIKYDSCELKKPLKVKLSFEPKEIISITVDGERRESYDRQDIGGNLQKILKETDKSKPIFVVTDIQTYIEKGLVGMVDVSIPKIWKGIVYVETEEGKRIPFFECYRNDPPYKDKNLKLTPDTLGRSLYLMKKLLAEGYEIRPVLVKDREDISASNWHETIKEIGMKARVLKLAVEMSDLPQGIDDDVVEAGLTHLSEEEVYKIILNPSNVNL